MDLTGYTLSDFFIPKMTKNYKNKENQDVSQIMQQDLKNKISHV